MDRGSDIFKFIEVPWQADFVAFCKEAKECAESQTDLFGNCSQRDSFVYYSCTPWFDFTAVTNARRLDPSDTIPRIIFSKYYPEGEELMMHLSLDVNHRTIDGLHVGLLKEAIDREIAALE